MKNHQPHNQTGRVPGLRATTHALAATLAFGAMVALTAQADMYFPPATPGGLQVGPIMGNATNNNNNTITIPYTGLEAPYKVLWSTNLDYSNPGVAGVTTLKYPDYTTSVTVAIPTNVPAGTVVYYRLMMLGSGSWVGKWNAGALSTNNVFVGANSCFGCHNDQMNEWPKTAHGTAISSLVDINTGAITNAHGNSSCFVCHSVGNGQPGGFVDYATSSRLANVQCENCHGSASAHVNIDSHLYHPVNTVAAEVCGGCHSAPRHGTYNEWTNSPHSQLVEEFPESQMFTCGTCHVGAARLEMVKNYERRHKGLASSTNYLEMPAISDEAAGTASCVVCHDPHSDALTAQLRNPMNSTNYFGFYSGSTTDLSTNAFGVVTTSYKNDVFSAQYNPNIQICGQCHNGRGVRWDGKSYAWNASSNAMVLGTSQSFSRGPHHSPQYNILIGIIQPDYLNVNAQGVATNYFAAHSGAPRGTSAANTNQCVTCHMPTFALNASGSTNYLGHTFAMMTNNCTLCHGSVPNIEDFQTTTTNSIAKAVDLLNQWAKVKGPGIFGANYSKYGQNAWEYQNIGALASITNAGPSSTDATKVPDAIKQARFNLYSVLNDGSMGVHNPKYIPFLIADAAAKVTSQFSNANFAASTTLGYAPLTVNFTNLGTGVSTYAWDFGDLSTTNVANPTHVYAAAGLYTVTFTANGTEALTFTNYIQVVNKPVVSFSADQTTVTVGTPVTFTNTSSNIGDVTSWRWQFNKSDSATRVTATDTSNQVWTYTTNGTFGVYLRATTAGGSVYSTTNNIIVNKAP